MESSTITPADTNATLPPEQQVAFHSTASNYRVVRKPSRLRQLGESNEFEVVKGRDYQFYDGVLVAKTQDDIDWLRNYDSYGKFYFEPETAPLVENSAGVQAVIIQKLVEGDFAAIAEILVGERSSASRPEVIVACEAALKAAGQDTPAKPDVPIHELQRVRMGATAGVTPGVSPDPVPGTPVVDPSTLTVPDAPVETPVPLPPAAESVPDSSAPAQEPQPEAPVAPSAAPPEVDPATGLPIAPTDQLPPAGAAGTPAG